MEKKRLLNFEILKVIAMLMVVIQHYWLFSTTGRSVETGQPITVINYIFFQPFLIFCRGGVPLFVLISGYFLSVKEWSFNWERIALIWFYTFFYGLIGCAIFLKVTPELASDSKSLLKNILPLIGNQYWFITDYIALAFFAPFLSKLSRSLSRHQFVTLMFVIALFGMTFWFNFPFGNAIGIGNGYSFLFFVFLFFVGAYIRKYDVSLNCKYPIVVLLGTILAASLFCFTVESRAAGSVYVKFPRYNDLCVIVAVVFFLVVKDWTPRMSYINKTVAQLAPYALGVYLIHENVYVREHLWKFVKNVTPPHDFSSWLAIPSALLVPIIVFIACALIDFIVKWIIKAIRADRLVGHLATRVNLLSDRLVAQFLRYHA